MNCFFMTAYVSATMNGNPLGGGGDVAAFIRAGGRPSNLEEEGLRVRAAVVNFLQEHKTQPIPREIITGRVGEQRLPWPTWEGLYHQLTEPDNSFDDYVRLMSKSGVWGTAFEQRVLYAMGVRVLVAKGQNRRAMRVYQQPMDYVPMKKGESVWYHIAESHYNVLIAPSE